MRHKRWTLRLADWIMFRRARRLLIRLNPHLPPTGRIVDIGSGTGHNAAVLASQRSCTVEQFDVAEIHWIDPPPIIFVDSRLPLPDDYAACALILHVLQYCDDPQRLLGEAARVATSRVLVMQTTARGFMGRLLLPLEEFCFGRLGFYAARIVGLVASPTCPLVPRRSLDSNGLRQLIESSPLHVLDHTRCSPAWFPLQCQIYVLAKEPRAELRIDSER